MSEQSILGLTHQEKEVLLSTLDIFKGKMDLLVKEFYLNFLKSNAGSLFQNTDFNRQYMMFASSIGVIITHIDHPMMLKEHLNDLVQKHTHYGVLTNHVDDFIEAFHATIKDVFINDFDKQKIELWYKLINSVMLYFKDQLH